jgi:small GTP-binding protein
MPSTARKICLVGEPGVGKSTLVRRLAGEAGADGEPAAARPANGISATSLDFSADGDGTCLATLWDIAGRSALDTLNQAFLSGIDGIAAVADATRPASAAVALRLVAQIRRLYPGTPAILLLNKRDVAAPFAVAVEPAAGVEVFEVSARDGDNVRAAFAALARRAHAR